MTITGNVRLAVYDISVTNIGPWGATISWKTNAVADGMIEYGATTTYGSVVSSGVMAKEHTIILLNLQPGRVYHFRLISIDNYGNRAVSSDLTFRTRFYGSGSLSGDGSSDGGGGDGGGGGGGHGTSTFTGPGESQLGGYQLPGLPGPVCQDEVSQDYSAGCAGLLYNADGNNTLDLDIREAQASGADVSIEPDHIDIYPHKSADLFFRFPLETSDIGNTTKVVKHATSAEIWAGPLGADFTTGLFSGSFHAMPTRILPLSRVNITLSACIPEEVIEKIRNVSAQNNLELEDIPFTMNVSTINLPETGSAQVTMTLPVSRVDREGGTGSIHIARISGESGPTELLDTVSAGRDTAGAMIFRADSPPGTTQFVIFSARPANPRPQDQVQSRENSPAMLSEGLSNPLLAGFILIIGLAALAIIVVFFGWRRNKEF